MKLKYKAFEFGKMYEQVRVGGMFDGTPTAPTTWNGSDWVNLTGGEHTKVLPYTGVKDINKKESYLGDILKEPVHQYSSKKDIEKRENSFGIVKKYKNSNNLYLEWNFRRKYEGECYWDSNELPITHIDRYEIVGNIYTDPDMIKKED